MSVGKQDDTSNSVNEDDNSLSKSDAIESNIVVKETIISTNAGLVIIKINFN